MNKVVLVLFLLVSFQMSFAQSEDLKQIRRLMENQEKAWNRADLEGFMEPYWHSDSLVFIGKSGPKYGWQTTLDNYKKSYPDASSMGKLRFENLRMEILSESEAFVLGKWTLNREKDQLSGYYTLRWRKINGKWKIILDHSS